MLRGGGEEGMGSGQKGVGEGGRGGVLEVAGGRGGAQGGCVSKAEGRKQGRDRDSGSKFGFLEY